MTCAEHKQHASMWSLWASCLMMLKYQHHAALRLVMCAACAFVSTSAWRGHNHTGWQCSPPTPVRCRSNKQQYCEQHGYAFIDASSLLDGTWHHITLPVAAVPLHLAHPRLDMHAGINISQV